MEYRLLAYLKENKEITSWEAIKEFGCTRLSQYIYLLRNKGYLINDIWEKATNRYGEQVHFKKYILQEET